MRLGGPIFNDFNRPEGWVEAARESGYTACYAPVDANSEDTVIKSYSEISKRENIVIAEVGAWSNPLSPDEDIRKRAIQHCKQQLELAERLGACCCVNISGSRGQKWDGPHPANLRSDTFDMIVAVVRDIIDEIRPQQTFYTLETMPWMYPDSAESYLELIKAIDRMQFGVHFDAVNLICSPQRYFTNGALITDFVHKLKPYIKSCHAKDIILRDNLTVHLDETTPGLGGLDYRTLLCELDRLDPDIPLMLEHLSGEDDYISAGNFIKRIAEEEGITLK